MAGIRKQKEKLTQAQVTNTEKNEQEIAGEHERKSCLGGQKGITFPNLTVQREAIL